MATVEGRKNKEFDEEFNTYMMLGPEFEKLSVVKTTCGDKQLRMGHELPVNGFLNNSHEVGEEVQCGEVPRPVLQWGCSITQFTSFKYAWDNFSKQYRSRNIDEQDESQYVINY